MSYYWRPTQRAINEFLEWLFADRKTKKMLKFVPRGCINCELLYQCRDENNDWKCRNGCFFIKKTPIDFEKPIKIKPKRLNVSLKPIKRVVIAGSRNFTDYENAKEYIDFCISNIRKKYRIVIVCGGAKGADALGEKYAEENGLEIERYLADWNTFDKSAGPKRNELMAQSSDYIICFWDGKSRGTKSMIDFAEKYNKPFKIKYINQN